MKKLLAIAAALAVAASLTACGGGSTGGSSSGGYSGGAGGNSSSGGKSKSADGISVMTIDHIFIFHNNVYAGTYTGDVNTMAKIPYGSGTFTGSSPDGITVTASGEWGPTGLNGQGEVSWEAVDPSADIQKMEFKGTFTDSTLNGEGEMRIYYSESYADHLQIKYEIFKGSFVDDDPVGTFTWTVYPTDELAAKTGFDHSIAEGTFDINSYSLEKPYTMRIYSGDTLAYEEVVE